MAPVQIDQLMQAALRHHEAGRLPEAEGLYRQVLLQQSNHAGALHLLGVLATQMGRFDLAVALIEKSIQIDPARAEFYINLGEAYRRLGKSDEAIASFERAIALNPKLAEAYNNLGIVLLKLGRADEAIAACNRAIALKPDYSTAYDNLGHAHYERVQLDQAIVALRRAIELNPSHAESHANLGNILRETGRLDEAIASCRRAVALKPDYPEALDNIGSALFFQGHHDQSIEMYKRAIVLKPDYAEAYCNLGTALKEKGDFDAAMSCFDKSLELKPDYSIAHRSRAMLCLLMGDFERGWAEYEWRWQTKEAREARKFPQPRWDGSPLEGKTILLHPEQGFGDTIQFLRYVPMVADRGGKVILEAQPELRRLLKDFPGVHQLVPRGDPLPAFDVQCPLLSLALAFGTTLETIPGSVPYLHADPVLVEKWKQKLGPNDGTLRVGLAWAGNPRQGSDHVRSLHLNRLAPLAAAKNVTFYSLQKGYAAEQTKSLPTGMKLVDLSAELTDFAETAALMMNLDLILSTCTSVPHLAGALGRPVWIMVSHVADWRWLAGRQGIPWYPSVRLWRQRSPGDWDELIQRMGQSLGEMGINSTPANSVYASS